MGKIRMCNVFWFVLEYTIVFVSGETGLEYPLVTESHQSTSSDHELDMTTSSVANVTAESTGKPEECATNPSSYKISAASSTLGVAVGIHVAFIVVVGIIAVIVFIRRSQQDIALPQYPTNNRTMYSQATSSKNTQGTECGQGHSHPSKDTHSPYALSEEEVYDKANERRHVVKDRAIYSRAIDTVYDSPKQHTRQERKEGTYEGTQNN